MLDPTATPQNTDEQMVLQQFGAMLPNFPTTKQMSDFARSVTQANPTDLDSALMLWVQREEALFKALEKVGVAAKLKQGFSDVDDFISFSLSVQNRRKSRMGHALENHLAYLWQHHGIKFREQVRIAGSRVDFVFPSGEEVIALSVKSTLKERWRQVLDEAAEVRERYLCTIDRNLTANIVALLHGKAITPVVPAGVQQSYRQIPPDAIITVKQFANIIRMKQGLPPIT